MSFEHKPNTISLFRNENKMTDAHPDYKGSGVVMGKEVWASGWINEVRGGEKAGTKYMSIRLEEKQQPQKQGKAPQNFDEDIPF